MVCLSGRSPQMNGCGPSETISSSLGDISDEAAALLTGLLKTDPRARLHAGQIPSDSFFEPSVVVSPQRPPPQPILDSSPSGTSPLRLRYPKSFVTTRGYRTMPRVSSAPSSAVPIRFLDPPSHRTGDRKRLHHDPYPGQHVETLLPGRRFFSAPRDQNYIPSAQRTPLLPIFATPSTTEESVASTYRYGIDDSEAASNKKIPVQHPLLRPPTLSLKPQGPQNSDLGDLVPGVSLQQLHGRAACHTITTTAGTDHRIAMNTSYLAVHTYKVAKGQLTILPSMSLLIDFREGERRSGRKGSEILRVDPEGRWIEVFSAPHLSSPSCLMEPTTRYELDELPAAYYKQYEDASRIISQVKQRIPKLILHRPEAKYILMANDPHGDIEIISPPPQQKGNKDSGSSTTAVQTRIRFSRHSRLVEVSRFSGPKNEAAVVTGEWTKKAVRVISEDITGLHYVEADTATLDTRDWDSLKLLADFLPICVAVTNWGPECSRAGDNLKKPVTSSGDAPPPQEQLLELLSHPQRTSKRMPYVNAPTETRQREGTPSSSLTAASGTSILTRITVPPRPAKLPTQPVPRLNGLPSSKGSPARTKFLPDIGWCASSNMNGGDTHQLLFLDGVSLVVNTGDGIVSMTSVDGTHVEYMDGTWERNPAVHDRMMIFETVLDTISLP
ncbi:hypothetical protein BXZ70DRAFT_594195 [Cristinia sonorae]|uniref:Cryptic POLO box 1 (CPB1) domain-containing protein n=1 Tax=Cristinia sonorae TaxID=1940300 RepID=A0A8K0UTX2_9AGAR|nr:hypothetical protein BXZ70DRAFT_594195 [Cristinia sonorae]